MIDLDEIGREIDRLEHSETTYANCERLSVLYAVREQYGGAPKKRAVAERYSLAAAPSSEFISAFKAAPIDQALMLIDEHMEHIQLLYPKEYRAIVRKLNEMRE